MNIKEEAIKIAVLQKLDQQRGATDGRPPYLLKSLLGINMNDLRELSRSRQVKGETASWTRREVMDSLNLFLEDLERQGFVERERVSNSERITITHAGSDYVRKKMGKPLRKSAAGWAVREDALEEEAAPSIPSR